MATVYRIESITETAKNSGSLGLGAYRCGVGHHLSEGEDIQRHPTPDEDMKLSAKLVEEFGSNNMPAEYNCCFENETAMLQWFSGLRKESVLHFVMNEYPDVRIAAYRSDDVIHGSFQSILKGDTVELIETYPLDKYL